MSALAKPAHGAPCNACGYCCKAVICPLGAHIFERERGPCPAIVEIDGRSECGLAYDPARFVRPRSIAHQKALGEGAAILIGSGVGCDALLDGEKPDPALYERMRALKGTPAHATKVRAAIDAWREFAPFLARAIKRAFPPGTLRR